MPTSEAEHTVPERARTRAVERAASIDLPYGRAMVSLRGPGACTDFVGPPGRRVGDPTDPYGRVGRALDAGFACVARHTPHGGMPASVCVLVTDHTRPDLGEACLRPLVERLVREGVSPAAIEIVVASGRHQAMHRGHLDTAAGRFELHTHDAADGSSLRYQGRSRLGIPVWLNRRAVDAELVVCVGLVFAHSEAGFSGGMKAVVPGVAGEETIRALHSLATDPLANRGRPGTTFRVELEDAARRVGPVLALNVVLDPCGRVRYASFGEGTAAHRACVTAFRERYLTAPPARYDGLLISAGGAPWDCDLFQAEGKALRLALRLLQPGGWVVFAARCRNGFGSAELEEAVRHGGHGADGHASRKAHFFQQIVRRSAALYLVSELDDAVVRRMGAIPLAAGEVRDVAGRHPSGSIGVVAHPQYVVWEDGA